MKANFPILVVQFIYQKEVICNASFAWAGTTRRAASKTKAILDAFRDWEANDKNPIPFDEGVEIGESEKRGILALKHGAEALHAVGAGISAKEQRNMMKYCGGCPFFINDLPFHSDTDGSIALSPKGVHENYQNQACMVNILTDEGRVEFYCLIPLNEETVRSYAMNSHLSPDEYRCAMESKAVDVGQIDPLSMSFAEFDHFAGQLAGIQGNEHRWLRCGDSYPYSTTYEPVLNQSGVSVSAVLR